jgi:hypothetical protein
MRSVASGRRRRRALLQATRVDLEAIRVAQGALYEDLVGRLEALEGEGRPVGAGDGD